VSSNNFAAARGAVALSALVALVLIASPFAAAQEPLFVSPLVPGTPSTSGSLTTQTDSHAVGDLNGDGRLDVVATLTNAVGIEVRLNNGADGWTAAPAVASTPNQTRALELADLNGDGDLDLAYNVLGVTDAVAVRLGNGDGTFGAPTSFAAAAGPRAIVAALLNDDAVPDLAVACAGDRVSVAMGNGDGTFGAAMSYAAGSVPNDVAAGDLDDDGDVDLAVADWSGSGVSVLTNDGEGLFTASPTMITATTPTAVALGRMNADALVDIVVSHDFVAKVGYLPGLPGGGFGAFVNLSPSYIGARDVAVGDVDEDGDDDAVSLIKTTWGDQNYGEQAGLLLRNDGGTFASVQLGIAPLPVSVVLADVNGDGDLDVVAHGSTGSIEVLQGDGDATFRAGNAAWVRPHDVTIGDWNNDGHNDLVTVGHVFDHAYSVLMGTGNGFFAPFTHTDFNILNNGVQTVTSGDFDEDGNLDLAAGFSSFFAASVSVLRGNGDGTFGAQEDAGGNLPCRQLITADVNGDQHLDLVSAAGAGQAVQVLRGLGDGTFGAPTTIALPPDVESVAAADFNEDDAPDLIAISNTGFRSVILNDGAGNFGAPITTALAGVPDRVATADFNVDGRPDLVVTDEFNNAVRVLLGQPGGAFGAPLVMDAGVARGRDVWAGDLDHDGDGDILVSSDPNDQNTWVTLFTGLGNGTFAAAVNLLVPDMGGGLDLRGGLDVGDLDGDGTPDIAHACKNQAFVILNRSGPWDDLGQPLAGIAGLPKQIGEGTLQPGAPFEFTLKDARPSTSCWHIVGLSGGNFPFKGGTLVPVPLLINGPLPTGGAGQLVLAGNWPGAPTGVALYLQFIIQDIAAVQKFALSNALKATMP
jgi:hypothetical protein